MTLTRCPACRQRHHTGWGHCPSCAPIPGPLYKEEYAEPPEPIEKLDIEASLPVQEEPNDLYRDWSHDTGEDELDRQEYPWLR